MNSHKTDKSRRRVRVELALLAFALFATIAVIFLLPGSSSGPSPAMAVQSSAGVGESGSSGTANDATVMVNQLSGLFEKASKAVSPSVVPIYSEQVVETGGSPFGPNDLFHQFFGDDFYQQFFGQRKQTIRGLGSGVIVSSDGVILTNNHVVKEAQKLTVILNDKKELPARVIGTDPQTDLAVIKIDAHDLPAAELGNSDNVKVGQWVIAVGNPFRLLHTVTAGIISAKGRSSIGLAEYEDFLQTDASINPGNSGGALCDLDGKVIGINTAISSPSGVNAGIGFAIPVNMARGVMDALLKDGKVSRGYLALVPQDIDENLAKALKLKSTKGALVGDVMPDGPADKAGLKRGDVIVEFDGKKITDSTELRKDVALAKPGSTAELTVERNGHSKHFKVKLGERPTEVAATNNNNSTGENANQTLGMRVEKLTPEIAKQLGYENDKGVVVVSVEPGSPAESAGLQRGDLVEQVDNTNVASVEDFSRAVSHAEKGDSVPLLVRRGRYTFYVAVELS
jgi:serine protease Do